MRTFRAYRHEERFPNEVKVITLRMIEERLTEAWLKGEQ